MSERIGRKPLRFSCDGSPLTNLVLVELIDYLPRLAAECFVPDEVWREVLHPSVPTVVREWAHDPPAWLTFESGSPPEDDIRPARGAGEAAAIRLAGTRTLLSDDKTARSLAGRLGIPVIGTLGLVRLMADEGWIDHAEAIARLRTDTRLYFPAGYEA